MSPSSATTPPGSHAVPASKLQRWSHHRRSLTSPALAHPNSAHPLADVADTPMPPENGAASD